MAEQLKVLNEIRALIQATKGDLDGVGASIVEISKNARAAKTAFQFNSPKEVNVQIQKTVQATGQLNAQLKEQERLEKALVTQLAKKDAAMSETNKELAKARFETQQLNKAAKEEGILTSKLSTFYQKQNVILNRLTRRRQDLLLKQKLGIQLDKKEVVELARLTRSQKKLDAAFKNTDATVGRHQRSVGNYGKALGSLKNVVTGLVGAFGIVEGVRLAFDFTKEAIALAREAKGVEFAFAKLGATGVDSFNRVKKATRGLLSDLSIKTALNEFEQFNLSVERTDTLFEFLAVAASQTGKSIDELKSSLVEGLSKESKLRIDNLGISAGELNAELEKTPEFIDAVANIAERKIAKAGDILDDAANGGERLAASFENSKLAFGQLFTSNSRGFDLLGGLAKELDNITNGLKSLKRGLEVVSNGFKDLFKPIKDIISQIPFFNKRVEESSNFLIKVTKHVFNFLIPITALSKMLKRIGAGLRILGASLSGIGAAFVEVKKNVVEFVEALSVISDVEFDLFNPKKTAESAKNALRILKSQFIEGAGDVATAFTEAYNNALKLRETPVVKKIKDEDEDDDGITKRAKEQVKAFEGIIEAGEKTKEFLGTLFSDGIIGVKEYERAMDDVTQSIKDIQEGLGATTLASGEGLIGAMFPEDAVPKAKEKIEEVKTALESINEWTEENREVIDKAFDVFNEVGNLAQAFSDRRISQIDDEINKNEEYYSKFLDNERLTDQERAGIEAEAEARRVQLEKKKREEQAKQARVQKAATAAEVVMQTSLAVISALAQTPKFDFGVSAGLLAASYATLGALQLATVLAQPIPQFKDGHLEGTHEGAAWINDDNNSRKFREIVERKDGTLEMFNKRNQLIHMNRGDRVHKAGTFEPSKLMQTAITQSYMSQSDKLATAQMRMAENQINEELVSRMEKAVRSIPKSVFNAPSANAIGKATANAIRLNSYADKA